MVQLPMASPDHTLSPKLGASPFTWLSAGLRVKIVFNVNEASVNKSEAVLAKVLEKPLLQQASFKQH
jgi:hypothetical protein